MKDEMTKQCESAWKRGYELGLVLGAGVMLLTGSIISLLWRFY